MDKDSGASLTIANSGDIIVTNSLTFTSGIVNTNAQGTLTTNCNVVVSGGTDCGNPISYVNGPFTRTLCTTTPTNMYFPVGKGGNFRPTWLEPTQTTAGATTYTVEQFEGFPPNYCVPEDLTCLSKARWYRVERGNTVPMIDPITITYCANDGVTHPNNLRIAKQEGNCWKNMGGVGTSATQGTITSTVDFTEYGDFVLANDTDCMNPLPVQLLSFEGNYSNSIEYLKWVTASEKNNDRFEVMRSEDGVNWYMIGEVQGNGFSEKLQEYFYEDHDIPMGATVLYYRLRQVDYNGDFEYHPIIVQDLNNTKITLNSINVFPNPAKDKFSVVNLGNTRMPNTIKVLDLYGHLLLQKDFNGSTEVNTMDYPTGIYMLKITNAQGMVVDVRKIQISK
jgi:trimeric autotransporter adhesin